MAVLHAARGVNGGQKFVTVGDVVPQFGRWCLAGNIGPAQIHTLTERWSSIGGWYLAQQLPVADMLVYPENND